MRPTPPLTALSTTACLLALTLPLTACGSDDGDTEAPPAPTGVTVHTSSSTSVHVMWDRSADAGDVRRYEVHRDGVKVKNVPAERHMVDVTGLKASASYTFSVRARDAAGNLSKPGAAPRVTTPSAAADDSQAPSRPNGLDGRADGPRSATLTWKRSKDDNEVTSYDIHQAGTKIHSVDGAKTTASVTTLRPGTRYTFTVKARDAADNASPASPAVTVTTKAEPEGATRSEVPADLQATARTENGRHHLDLTWNAPKEGGDITEYEVYVNGKFGSKLTLGEAAPKDTGTISLPVGKKAGTTYAVKVRAKLPDGNWGRFTEEIKVTTAGDPS
ncbi:fibronectin type III domain-containing protein [Streptomyces armeniacus]|uniref:Fibronectin type III domain-containing protein n=1 Tax=Streptomyces armeniacus TaxID=83291 RepID=A0A345XU78_9ACTN|nr:fibronectin type III domain-containing protein [Streptomyces armeniacus]AXK35194.1 fibronectin type III domain-containing protein [Streptomyces armeniacus]